MAKGHSGTQMDHDMKGTGWKIEETAMESTTTLIVTHMKGIGMSTYGMAKALIPMHLQEPNTQEPGRMERERALENWFMPIIDL